MLEKDWNKYIGDNIRKHPTLNQQEIVELYKGRNPDNLHKIKLAHLRYINKFAWSIVKKYYNKELGDIMNWGYIILNDVVERYSPDAPNAIPFTHYLSCQLNNRIRDYIRNDAIVPVASQPALDYIATGGGRSSEIVSLDMLIDGKDNKDKPHVIECIQPTEYNTALHYLINKEENTEIDRIINQIIDNIINNPKAFIYFKKMNQEKSRTKLEQIVKMWMEGESYIDISRSIELDYHRTKNIIGNVRFQMFKFLGRKNTKAYISQTKRKKCLTNDR